jgi:hypothetical protein
MMGGLCSLQRILQQLTIDDFTDRWRSTIRGIRVSVSIRWIALFIRFTVWNHLKIKKRNKSELSKNKNINQIRFVFTRPSCYCSRRANRWVAVFSFPLFSLVRFLKKDNLIDSIKIGRGADSASAIGSTTTVAKNFSTADIGCCQRHRRGRVTTGRLLV